MTHEEKLEEASRLLLEVLEGALPRQRVALARASDLLDEVREDLEVKRGVH